jgi:NAD(P)-dependent dehydrogenase (short-subunit alcohol dehydrogenase family)
MGGLNGRHALVTGGTAGIGEAIAVRLADDGAHVVITGRRRPRGDAVARQIREAGGRATFIAADLAAGADAVAQLVHEVATAVGEIDLLVNNAALLLPAKPFPQVTESDIQAVFAVNVVGPFLLTAALVPAMIARGSGVIVNVGSISGISGFAGGALYGASKAALHSLTRSWAVELAQQGVRVNTVVPGPTVSDTNTELHDALRQLASGHPAGRPAAAAEVAAAVSFLASDEASHIHGITLPVDGGALAGLGSARDVEAI